MANLQLDNRLVRSNDVIRLVRSKSALEAVSAEMETKMSRVRVPIALAAAIAGLTLAGCSEEAEPAGSPDEPVTIEFWSMPFAGHTEEEVTAYVEEFNETHDAVQVNLTLLQWADGREKITQAISAGIGPEVFLMAPLNQDYIDAGALATADDLGFTDEDLDPFIDVIDAFRSPEGELYGIPLGFNVNVLYYNTTILEQYGFDAPPTTWDALYETASTITTESAAAGTPISGFQIKGMDDHLNAINHTWANYFYEAGGRLLNDGLDESTLNSPEGVEALEFLKKLYGTAIPGTSAADGFMDGSVAMFQFQQLHLPVIATSDLTDEWALAPMPAGPDNSSGFIDAELFVASSTSEHLAQAGEFIRWMTAPEQTVRYAEKAPVFPYELEKVSDEVRAEAEAIVAGDPNRQVLLDQLELASTENLPIERYATTARWDASKQHLVAAINGSMGVEEALDAIDAAVDEALKSTAE